MIGKENDLEKMFRMAYTKYQKLGDTGSFYIKLIRDEELKALDTENRWSLTSGHGNESVSQHTYWVAIYTWILCKKQKYDDARTGRALTYATFHDFDEIFTGDINHKFKYAEDNGIDREQVKAFGKKKTIEKLKSFGIKETDILSTLVIEDEIKKLVKLADWFSAMQYLTFELGMGNRLTKTRQDFLYCLIKLCEAIEEFTTTKKKEEIDADLASLFLGISSINNKIYGDK